jgi:hypothetical protein
MRYGTFAARALFLVALAFTLYMALLPHPPKLPIDTWGDKAEHSLAFVTLSLLAFFALPDEHPLRLGEHLSFIGALIEVVQAIPALHRDCDILDWATDTAAIALTLFLLQLVRTMWPELHADRSERSHQKVAP